MGITAPAGLDDLPNIDLSGGGTYRIGGGQDTEFVQNHYSLQDSLTYVHGSHVLRFGGGITRSEVNIPSFRSNATITFNTFADFLLGLSAAQNGSSASNIAGTSYAPGLRERAWRVREGFAYLQDDFKVTRRLTLNLGLRYERIGHFAEAHGLDANFNFALANPNPPATGSFEGFVVPSNFPGAVPAGVTRLDGDLSINGNGRNALEPRVGFAWQVLPNPSRLVLRGGYGIYHSRLTGQTPFQLVSQQPFSTNRNSSSPGATFSNPFPQPLLSASDFPLFTTPYSPTTALTLHALAPDYRPSIVQQYGLNIQSEIARDFLLEVGYVGTRGTHLLRTRSLNQALLASPEHPIRGVTTNTVANISQRAPIRGFAAAGIVQIETSGYSWYNGLEVSLTKRFSRGLQFQAFYSFSKSLAAAGANVESNSSGEDIVLGNQNDSEDSYGRAIFDRTHRFVIGYVYEFPIASTHRGFFARVFGGWGLAGVTVIQSGPALTILAQNVNNVFGITADRAQLAPGCTYADLPTPGSVSQRVDQYFNTACVRPGRPIGDDRRGTTFGNSGVGIIEGPGQNNFDIALFKRTPVGWLTEGSNIEFRAEFFNVFNHPQFANPNLLGGNIVSTSVSPRVVQFALKFNF
ncbi:MAG: TonB-dependent receptor domain-containing protein [Blastocatellia bacterium]